MTCDNCGSDAVPGGTCCFVCLRMATGEPPRPHDEAWVRAEIEWNETHPQEIKDGGAK